MTRPPIRVRAVDLFAGLGGFTEGAARAGVQVVWAANHWKAAVDVHARNHPHTDHACQDLRQADWASVPAHDLLLASPACQGHSHARGKERRHYDATRSTAWAVVECAEAHRPAYAIVENVPKATLRPAATLGTFRTSCCLIDQYSTEAIRRCSMFQTNSLLACR